MHGEHVNIKKNQYLPNAHYMIIFIGKDQIGLQIEMNDLNGSVLM